jgi:DNA repair protein RadC
MPKFIDIDHPDNEYVVLNKARAICDMRMRNCDVVDSPATVHLYARLHLIDKEREVFCVIYVDTKNRVIHAEELFQGSLRRTTVEVREVVRHALLRNASAVIFVHNHPSGDAEPSPLDVSVTGLLQEALKLVDIKVLDPLIVGPGGFTSLANRGLM